MVTYDGRILFACYILHLQNLYSIRWLLQHKDSFGALCEFKWATEEKKSSVFWLLLKKYTRL